MARFENTDPLLKRTRQLTLRAQVRLYWEAYAPIFAAPAIAIGLFLSFAFFGFWERFGDPWRSIAIIITLYVVIKAALAARTIRRPSRSDARRRVERDSGAKHRPLDTLDDRPAISADLWPAHIVAARDAAALLGPPLPRAVLAPRDPYYFRFLLPVIAGLAMMVGYGDNMERFKRAMTPVWQQGISPKNISFEAWVTPPAYTGRPPIYFKDRRNVDIPAGSELVARISGAPNATRLKLSSQGRARYLPLTRLGPKSFETRAIVTQDSTARWRVGTLKKSWALNAVPDRPPVLNFKINPRPDKRDRLAFTYSFEDDYGVEALTLRLRLLTDDPQSQDDRADITVPLSGRSVREADFDKAALDLTKHRWAGKKVSARLIAKDGLGQQAETADVYFTVPDKIFVEPMAKAIVEHRSLILAGQTEYAPLPKLTKRNVSAQPRFDTRQTDHRLGRAAPSVQRAALLIDAITDAPSGLFEDPAIYLGLRNVLSRMRYAHDLDGLSGIPEDLWRIAIRAEFGILGTALEEMREAQQALRDGIARRAPQREVDTLFSRYNEAVDRYMEELRRKAAEDGNVADPQNGGGDARNTDEIQELMDAIEEANRIGDTEGARRALAQLAELLENMQIQLSASAGGSGDGEPMEGEMSEEMKKSLEDMADLLGEQRKLKDETEQADRRERQSGNQPSGSGGEDGQEQSGPEGDDGQTPQQLAERQGTLEDALEALSNTLPEPGGDTPGGTPSEDGTKPGGGGEKDGEDNAGAGTENGQDPGEALADARRAMERSENALQGGDLEAAARAQSDAIAALRRAGQGLAEQAGRSNPDGTQSATGENSDPLGRLNEGEEDMNSEADIDPRDNATRSRELLEELRRRASEQEREEQERQYLERLLKRF
ncbi:MAG: DUF4175 domain-containing protein [Alphaproteobacteria bacterium]